MVDHDRFQDRLHSLPNLQSDVVSNSFKIIEAQPAVATSMSRWMTMWMGLLCGQTHGVGGENPGSSWTLQIHSKHPEMEPKTIPRPATPSAEASAASTGSRPAARDHLAKLSGCSTSMLVQENDLSSLKLPPKVFLLFRSCWGSKAVQAGESSSIWWHSSAGLVGSSAFADDPRFL